MRDCCRWLLNELQKFADGIKSDDLKTGSGLGLLRRDHRATLMVVLHCNVGVKFVQLEISPVSNQGRSTWICIPAVVNGSGWRKFILGLEEVVGDVVVESLEWARFLSVTIEDTHHQCINGKEFCRGRGIEAKADVSGGSRGSVVKETIMEDGDDEERHGLKDKSVCTFTIKMWSGKEGLWWEDLPQKIDG